MHQWHESLVSFSYLTQRIRLPERNVHFCLNQEVKNKQVGVLRLNLTDTAVIISDIQEAAKRVYYINANSRS